MCFAHDAVPPIPPVQGAAITHERLHLTAADGTRFVAFEALSDAPGQGPGVVILPDVRGLFTFYEELALRFAELGYDAVAIDYFGRTADDPPRSPDFDWSDDVMATTQEGIRQDVAAAIARLRAADADRKIFTVGFCFGGSNSWHQAASGHGLAGAVGFYGHPLREGFPQGAPAVAARVGDMECPILGLMGGDDPGIPDDAVEEYRGALDAAGVENEIVIYPGAPHSFFDRKADTFAAESADAWARVTAFVAAKG
jgi:carboxymethylenebutenolidase